MNHRIYISILLGVVSVVGIILFQILWLSRTYAESERNFLNTVSSHLILAVDGDANNRYQKGQKKNEISHLSSNYSTKKIIVRYNDDTKYEKIYDNDESFFHDRNKGTHELVGVNLNSLDSLYSSYLAEYDIFLPYILEHEDSETGEILATTATPGDKTKYSYITKPHAWGLITPTEIRARFISPYTLIVDQMKWLFISAIILAFLLLGALLFLIQTIFHQKKIAEIRTDFVNVVVHELKGPLLYISKELEYNKDAYADLPDCSVRMDKIQQSTNRMNRMINKLLSATVKDKLLLDYSKFNLKELLESLKNSYIAKSGKPCTISLEYNNPDEFISADKLHLENLLVNLIDNAVKYSKEDARVWIECEKKENQVVISVRDNGIGIFKKDQKMIFDRYYRAWNSDGVKRYGFGLGLYYVKLVALAHGGKITVKSAPNTGSEFILSIPS